MGEMIEVPSNGSTVPAYLAEPEGGTGPGVVVIQEYWGLVDHIKDVCDRLAAEGFVALAPDLYHGETATEPDEAGKMLMALQLDRAARDMGGAVDAAAARSSGQGVGVIGFCMGGGLALVLACQRPDLVKAVVPFYGVIPWPGAQPDFSALAAAVQGHYAENDEFGSPEAVEELVAEVRRHGKEIEVTVHPGTEHAFFNDTRPEVHHPEASTAAWTAAVAFLRERLTR
jgi:carboxymethylenebutenolidase